MIVLMSVAALLAGLIHVLIFCMESLWWTTPQVRARFRQTPEQASRASAPRPRRPAPRPSGRRPGRGRVR